MINHRHESEEKRVEKRKLSFEIPKRAQSDNTYDILIIDAPWPQTKGGRRKVRPNQAKALDYKTMSIKDIFRLLDDRVFTKAKEQHTVFMWAIEKFLTECDLEMTKRGYRRHIRMIWNKTNGIAPAFSVRFAHEYLIWYYKPKFTKVSEDASGKFLSVFTETPREHSRKPDIAYTIISKMFPHSKILDVFSREQRTGIDQWGNQINHFQTLQETLVIKKKR